MSKQVNVKAYPKDFKEQVVKLAQVGDRSATQIARGIRDFAGVSAALGEAGGAGSRQPHGLAAQQGPGRAGTAAARVLGLALGYEDLNDHDTLRQMELFADRTSAQTMRANQLRLYFASFAYALLELLRRWGLSGTRLARAQCGTIRLKLLKIGVWIRVSVRAVRLLFDEGFPEAGLFGQVLARLQSLPLRC